jgi:hypothetical protein
MIIKTLLILDCPNEYCGVEASIEVAYAKGVT